MVQKITKIRRGVLQQGFLRCLSERAEKGTHFDKVLEYIEQHIDLTEYEKSKNPKGDVRWRVFLAFGTIPLAKFGYVLREKNIFWITDKGKKALEIEPTALREELQRLWDEAKASNTDDAEDEETEQVSAGGNEESSALDYVEMAAYLANERTLFKRVDYDLATLLEYIKIGDIGLPDIQRPFVWTPTKVRLLFDSMYRGFPVGYLLFWSNASVEDTRFIGTGERPRKIPHLLIVDGQQRLTALYAVFRGAKVLDDDYQEKQIEIAFRPRDAKFEVCDAAIRRDPEFIPNISELWVSKKSSRTLINEFLKRLGEKRQLSERQEELVSHNLDRLYDLTKYPFTALEITPTVDEEQVADIFVRINGEGVKLNQSDFILTLLSVFWEEGRKELERFCRESRVPTTGSIASPFNHFIKPDSGHLLRVEVAVGFYRGKLKTVYQLLRGRDLATGQVQAEVRDRQFEILKEAQKIVLDLVNWHGFFNCLMSAGFRSQELISSETCLIYCYAMYLLGKTRFRISEERLQSLIARYYFATSVSNRYVGSFESTIESDLNRIKDLSKAEEFITTLERIIGDSLTSDFWNITLPNQLDSSSAANPAFFAYLAAQNKLNAPVLFSKNKRIADLLDPSVRGPRKALEKHHLFPRAWLENEGIADLKLINQIANFALVDWGANGDISDEAPADYVKVMKKLFSEQEWQDMGATHALPPSWEILSYEAFLSKRRTLMAGVIRSGFEAIK